MTARQLSSIQCLILRWVGPWLTSVIVWPVFRSHRLPWKIAAVRAALGDQQSEDYNFDDEQAGGDRKLGGRALSVDYRHATGFGRA